MSEQDLLLVVDGGGTKTQAVLTDLDGRLLARGQGPSSNLHNAGFDESCRALTTAIEGALAQVMGPRSVGSAPLWHGTRIAAACFGLAGVDAPEDEAQVGRWVEQQAIAPRFMVVNDAELVLAAGTPQGWGIALVSGTGSVCLGRSPQGETVRVGGWGPLLGDEGSGYAIASRALQLATQAVDGRTAAPAVMAAVLAHWSVREPSALIRLVHAPSVTAADIAGMASRILDLADEGDASACAIVDEGAAELTRHVNTAIARLGLHRPPLALAGGVVRGRLQQTLLGSLSGTVDTVTYVADPPLGAVVMARRLLAAPAAS